MLDHRLLHFHNLDLAQQKTWSQIYFIQVISAVFPHKFVSYRKNNAWFWTTVSTTVSVTLGTRMIFSSTDIFGTSWESKEQRKKRSSRHFLVHFCRVPQRSSRQVVAEALPPQPGAMLETCSRQITSKLRFQQLNSCQVPTSTGFCTILCSSWTTCLTQKRTKCLSRDPWK